MSLADCLPILVRIAMVTTPVPPGSEPFSDVRHTPSMRLRGAPRSVGSGRLGPSDSKGGRGAADIYTDWDIDQLEETMREISAEEER